MKSLEQSVAKVESTAVTGEVQAVAQSVLAEGDRCESSDERFRVVAQATVDAIWDLDLETNLIWWGEGFFRLFGYTSEILNADLNGWASRIHPDDRERVVKSIDNAILNGMEPWREEYRFLRADDTIAHVVDRGSIIKNPSGKPIRMVGGMTDVTANKELEAQLLRAQRMESIGTLAGGIAHDLNNVLTPILMAITTLRMSNANSEYQSMLDTIERSAQRGADLVRQVLSFARGVEGRRMPIQASHVLREVQHLVRDTFDKSIEVELKLDPELYLVAGDPTQIHQILLNLCVNARDAMAQGGKLTLEAENILVDEQYASMHPQTKPGDYVMMKVSDNGCGIAKHLRERIFDPFFTTKGIGQGTGLGLSTVHALVQSHGGFLNLYSEPGRGTAVHIYLPAILSDCPISAATNPGELPRGHGELILVVDDEEAVREIIRKTLEAFGYAALLAEDGAQAVALYAENKRSVALVLTDMMMPIMDGFSTILALHRINPALPIIAASGLNANGMVAKAAGAGVKHFLPKPYTAETMLKVIAEVLAENVLRVGVGMRRIL